MKVKVLFTVLSIVGIGTAFWRMECRGRAGLARLDPLVSPKELSNHLHAIHGSSGFSEQATYEDLVNANCTSCAVTQDKSAYWTPALYFQHSNGTYELVPQVGGLLAYYFLNLEPGQNSTKSLTAFPEGFRMIAGDNLRRNYTITGNNSTITDPTQPDPGESFWGELGQTSQKDLAQRALGFNCLNYKGKPEGSLNRHYFPSKEFLDASCPQGLRLELAFPACWNGKDIDSSNHQSHIAYPDTILTGRCPKGFPVRMPGLMFETIWATNAYKGVEGRFVLSNGDVEGFGYHGDFMMGWPSQQFLQQAVDVCDNNSGLIRDCPLFDIVDDAVQSACSIDLPSALTKEKVDGMIGTTLPGNVQIQYGPGEATVDKPTATNLPVTPFTSATTTQGQVFQEPSTTSTVVLTPAKPMPAKPTPAIPTPAAPPPVVPPPVEPPPVVPPPVVTRPPPPPPSSSAAPNDPNAVSTKWITNSGVVNEIIYDLVTVTVTEEDVVTVTPAPKVRRHLAHYSRHMGVRRRA